MLHASVNLKSCMCHLLMRLMQPTRPQPNQFFCWKYCSRKKLSPTYKHFTISFQLLRFLIYTFSRKIDLEYTYRWWIENALGACNCGLRSKYDILNLHIKLSIWNKKKSIVILERCCTWEKLLCYCHRIDLWKRVKKSKVFYASWYLESKYFPVFTNDVIRRTKNTPNFFLKKNARPRICFVKPNILQINPNHFIYRTK